MRGPREVRWREVSCRQERKRNSHGKEPRTIKENSQGGDSRTPERKKDPSTFEGNSRKLFKKVAVKENSRRNKWKTRRKKKRRQEKAKCKKSTRTRWWSRIKKSFVSAFTRYSKEEEETMTLGKMASSPFVAGTMLRVN